MARGQNRMNRLTSIRMIKLGANSVAHPLTLMFQNSLVADAFSIQRKRANMDPIHMKNGKQILSNYRPVSRLPICCKIFEKHYFQTFIL